MVGVVLYGGLVQLVRASALHAEGRRFDSDILHGLFYGVLVQRSEYLPRPRRRSEV